MLYKKLISSILLPLFAAQLSGCGANRFVDKVTIEPSQTLNTIRVALVFQRTVQTELQGMFAIRDYGYIFLNPYTETQPFEVGFLFNTDILDNNGLIGIEPTLFLPNGYPHPIGHPLVVLGEKEVEDGSIDSYGYVDVLERSWTGVAGVFMFMGKGNFPDGLVVTESFLEDSSSTPRAHAVLYGPSLDDDGTLVSHGGVALFANVRALMPQIQAKRRMTLHRKAPLRIEGKDAEVYRAHPEKLFRYEQKLLKSLKNASN